MDTRRIYLKCGFLSILCFAALASCRRHEVIEPVFADEYICLDAVSNADTKGFLGSDGLKVDGTKLQMFDYVSGYNGTLTDNGGVSHSNGEEFLYIDNTLTYKMAAENWKWVFGDVSNPTSYRWTRTGVHHFYGWLLKDATGGAANLVTNGGGNFFDTYTPGTKTLTVSKSFTSDSPQYDFLYSEVVPVDVLTDGIPVTVPIPMKHLFGAIGITLQNSSKLDVRVSSVRLLNFPAQGSRTITWDMSNGVSLTESEPTSAGFAAFWPNKITSPITLYNIDDSRGGKTYDAYTGAEMGESLSYRMCWPMTQASLKPTITGTDSEGNNTYSSTSPLVEVTCKVGSAQRESTLTMRFPNADDLKAAISAGKKTQLNLTFADKQVLLSFISLPWEASDFPMAFEKDAVSATQLKFKEGTYDSGGKLTDSHGTHDVIKLKENSNPAWVAQGSFKVYTPVNGRLTVGLAGDTDAFVVTLEGGGTYTGNGHDYILIDPTSDGGLITLGIKPKGNPESGKRVFLHFAVTNNNRDTDADSEINRDKYVVVIP